MAKAKDKSSVEISAPDPENTREQDEALLHYRATGFVGNYVDPTRDQEPDIAREFGVAPHPELQNVAPPDKGHEAFPTAFESTSPVAAPFEEKEEAAEESEARVQAAADAANEANQAAYKAAKEEYDNPSDKGPPPQEPAELTPSDALNLKLTPDESPKTSSNVGPGAR